MTRVGLLFAAYVLLVAVAGIGAWQQSHGNLDEMLKVGGLYLAALSSLFTAIVAYLNVSRQGNIAFEVERLKADLAEEVERLKAVLAGDVERLKSSLATNVEEMKLTFSAANRAYEEVLAAMNKCYRALAATEQGEYDPDKVAAARTGMEAVEHLTDVLNSRACEAAFEDFWQHVTFVSEKSADAPTADARKQIWADNARQVASLREVFVSAFGRFRASRFRDDRGGLSGSGD